MDATVGDADAGAEKVLGAVKIAPFEGVIPYAFDLSLTSARTMICSNEPKISPRGICFTE